MIEISQNFDSASTFDLNKIDQISGIQIENGSRTYLVNWKTEENSSWIPEEDLYHATDSIKNFLATLMTSFIFENLEIKPKKKKKNKNRNSQSPKPHVYTDQEVEQEPFPETIQDSEVVMLAEPKVEPEIAVDDEEEAVMTSSQFTMEEGPTSEFAVTTVDFDDTPQSQLNKTILEQISSIQSSSQSQPSDSSYFSENSFMDTSLQPSSSHTLPHTYAYLQAPPMSLPMPQSPPNFLAQASLRNDHPNLTMLLSSNGPFIPPITSNVELTPHKILNSLFSNDRRESSEERKSEKKKYNCIQCNNSFSKSAHLARHMRTHTGDKPFQCKYCDKAFARNDNLTVHERTHTGEKPYNCGICGRMFNTRGDRNRHIQTHSDIPQVQIDELISQK